MKARREMWRNSNVPAQHCAPKTGLDAWAATTTGSLVVPSPGEGEAELWPWWVGQERLASCRWSGARGSWTATLVIQHITPFCSKYSVWSKEEPIFHKTTKMKSQFPIQKMLMVNLWPAMLLNTDWGYLDFWGKEGQVIFTVWKMKLTEFIFLCEAMIDFSFCLIHTALNMYIEQTYHTLDKAHRLH